MSYADSAEHAKKWVQSKLAPMPVNPSDYDDYHAILIAMILVMAPTFMLIAYIGYVYLGWR